MIERQWRESVPGRLAGALRLRYPSSLLGGMASAVSARYPASRLSAFLKKNTCEWGGNTSLYAALLTLINSGLFALGTWAGRLWRSSLTGALFSKVRNLSLWKGGLITSLLRGLGLRRLLLLAFALYLPLDWFFRLPGMPSIMGPLWHNAMLLACVMYVLWQRAAQKLPHHYTPVDTPMLLFMGVCVMLLFINSINMQIGISGMRATAQYMLWFFVISRMIRDERDWLLICGTLALVGTATALHCIYQYIVGTPIPENWVTQSEIGVRTRAFSITGSPNIMGDLMVMLMPLTLAFAYRKGDSWERKLFWWTCAGLQGLACIVTFSRGAWLGLAVAAVIFIALQDRRLFIGLLAAAMILVFIPEIMNRVAYMMTADFTHATTTGGRAIRQQIGFTLLRSSGYLFGMGHGRYGGAVAMQNKIVEWLTYHYLDNYYLKTLVETGIAGLTAYLLLIASTLATVFRSILRVKGTAYRPMLTGIMAAMCGVLVHCLFENIFEVPYMNSYFWGYAALACAAVRLTARPVTSQS